MIEQPQKQPAAQSPIRQWDDPLVQSRLKARYRFERLFKLAGLGAIMLASSFVVILLGTMIWRGLPGFFQSQLALEIEFASDVVGATPASARAPEGREAISAANYAPLIGAALQGLSETHQIANAGKPGNRRELRQLVSPGARAQLRGMTLGHPEWINTTQRVWLYLSDDADQYLRGKVDPDLGEGERQLSDNQIQILDALRSAGDTRRRFHSLFFKRGASQSPETAGILSALVGSALTMLVTLSIAFPLGVASAIYLEEFAPRNRWTDLVEVNLNNLAAVPSIVFGLLGLAVFLNVFHLPRSAPLVGGMTLALMTMPTIIISARAALQAVPRSIRSAAMALGASPMQVVLHHVVPMAMPGILTGTIIGMAQALGETAPLLMIGMVAFIVDVPGGVTDAATALPVQIFLWSDSPERAFSEKTAAAILVLLAFLISMNAVAVYLRKRFEKQW